MECESGGHVGEWKAAQGASALLRFCAVRILPAWDDSGLGSADSCWTSYATAFERSRDRSVVECFSMAVEAHIARGCLTSVAKKVINSPAEVGWVDG